MREILFRGKTAKGEWVEGFYVRNVYSVGFAKEPTIHENHYIYSKNFISKEWFNTAKVEVIQETVGQFTGLTDKNGKRIFEGDIVRGRNGIGVVKWHEYTAAFYVLFHEWHSNDANILCAYEVIGNIHDNPELLEAQNG